MIFRSSFETTFSVGTRSRSESESAKLSPIQLNSGLSDVFSNGSTSTVSVPCACAATANIAVIKNRYKYFLNICLFFLLSVPSWCPLCLDHPFQHKEHKGSTKYT